MEPNRNPGRRWDRAQYPDGMFPPETGHQVGPACRETLMGKAAYFWSSGLTSEDSSILHAGFLKILVA